MDPFWSYEENEGLWIRPLDPIEGIMKTIGARTMNLVFRLLDQCIKAEPSAFFEQRQVNKLQKRNEKTHFEIWRVNEYLF